MWEVLVTLLVYLIIFAIIYYIVMAVLAFVKATPEMLMVARAIMALLALLFVIALFFGVPYPAPRIHFR